MRRVASLTLLAPTLLVAACAFEKSGLGPGDGPDADVTVPDADLTAPDAPVVEIDAGACPAPVVLAVQIDGVPVDETTPPKDVLVGDSVRISFDGSCVASGPATILWTLSPIDGTSGTALGPERDFTVYSVVADVTYVLDVELAGESLRIDAFTTHGFERIDGLSGNDADIRQLAVGSGRLWLATKANAWSMPLATPGTFTNLTATWTLIDTPPQGLRGAHFDGTYVWFGDDGSNTQVWRGDPFVQAFYAIDYSHDLAFGEAADILDISAAAPGVHIMGSDGVATAPDSFIFSSSFTPALDPVVYAVALAAPRAWGGGRALYDLADPAAATFPFGGTGDQRIRSMVADGAGSIWIGSSTLGLARIDAATGAVIDVFDESSGLADNDIDELAVDSSGDVWFTYTTVGIGRWKRDRNEIASFGDDAGLAGRLTGRAIAFHDPGAGGRVIFAGTTTGLVYAHLP